jgi:hypothetical protein
MESPQLSDQQVSRLTGQVWECTNSDARKSGTELAETVLSLGTLSFPIERLEHSRIGETVQVGLTYWRRVE